MVASSLDAKGIKAIIKNFVFLTNQLVFPNMVTYNSNNNNNNDDDDDDDNDNNNDNNRIGK